MLVITRGYFQNLETGIPWIPWIHPRILPRHLLHSSQLLPAKLPNASPTAAGRLLPSDCPADRSTGLDRSRRDPIWSRFVPSTYGVYVIYSCRFIVNHSYMIYIYLHYGSRFVQHWNIPKVALLHGKVDVSLSNLGASYFQTNLYVFFFLSKVLSHGKTHPVEPNPLSLSGFGCLFGPFELSYFNLSIFYDNRLSNSRD